MRESLSFVELEHTLDKFPSELSGGMRRRVGIARAIVTEPQLVLYDSPTAGLDPITANTIINLILKGRDMRNTATIMVTHRYQDGHLMANFRYNPSSGKIRACREQPIDRGPGSSSCRRAACSSKARKPNCAPALIRTYKNSRVREVPRNLWRYKPRSDGRS